MSQKHREGENEDHTEEREIEEDEISWKIKAPRWALVTAIGLLLIVCGWLVGRNSNLDASRLNLLEKYQSDSRWEMLSKLSEQQAVMAAQIRQHDEQLSRLAKMADRLDDINGNVRELTADVRAMKNLVQGRHN